MRLAVDATPLLGRQSGVGRYVRSLLAALHGIPDAPVPELTLFSLRARVKDPPAGSRPSPRRLPARLLQPAWRTVGFPPVEWLTGPVDVFHAGNFVLPPARRAAGVVTVHDLSFLHHAHTVDKAVLAYRSLVPSSIARAAAVITVSHAVKAEICEAYGVAEELVTVSHNGVDGTWSDARLSADTRRRLALPEKYVLYAGNVEPRKNLRTLAVAHARARAEAPDTPPLVMVGPPGWGDVWGDTKLPGAPDVLHLGYLPEMDLRAVVAGAAALCMPSWYEGFGMPVLEAMACRTPVLASDIPAHREIAAGHATLIGAGDVDSWSAALADLPQPSAAALDVARSHALGHTWEAAARTHLEVWRRAAGLTTTRTIRA